MVIDHSVRDRRLWAARRARSSTPTSNTSAIASATSSCAGARRRSTTSRWCRRARASCTRSTSSTSRAPSWSATGDQAYPDSCVGTDSHTTMINGLGVLGLGRWRHRGRGGDAGPAGVDAHSSRRWLQAHRHHPGGRHGDRRCAHHHRDAAPARGGRQVRRVLRRGRWRGAAREPRDDRQHDPRVRLDGRDVPDRRRHDRLPAPHRPRRRTRSRSSRRTPRAGPVARPVAPTATWSRASPSTSSSTSSTVVPSIAGPKRPQDRVALTGQGAVPARPADLRPELATRSTRPRRSRSRRPTRPRSRRPRPHVPRDGQRGPRVRPSTATS